MTTFWSMFSYAKKNIFCFSNSRGYKIDTQTLRRLKKPQISPCFYWSFIAEMNNYMLEPSWSLVSSQAALLAPATLTASGLQHMPELCPGPDTPPSWPQIYKEEIQGQFRVLPGCPHAGASVVCSSPCWKPRNVPAHWRQLTPRGGRDKQGSVLYLAYLTAEIIFKMVLTYIVLTQRVLILHYLGNVLCTKLCLEMSLAQILSFAITCSLDMYLKGGTISSMCQDSKCVLSGLQHSLIPNLTDIQYINILQN